MSAGDQFQAAGQQSYIHDYLYYKTLGPEGLSQLQWNSGMKRVHLIVELIYMIEL